MASALETGTILKWFVEDDGGLEPIKGVVEVSENFEDSDFQIEGENIIKIFIQPLKIH